MDCIDNKLVHLKMRGIMNDFDSDRGRSQHAWRHFSAESTSRILPYNLDHLPKRLDWGRAVLSTKLVILK
jgi:hypothetical protein